MSYSNGLLQSNTNNIAGIKGKDGKDGVGFSLTSSGDYNIDNKILFNVKTQDDVPEDSDYDSIKKDYQSVPNKEYLNNHFLKRDKTGVYYDLRGLSIENSEVYNPNSWTPKTITNKEYVDLKDNEIKTTAKAYTDSTFHLSNTLNKDYIDTEIHRVSSLTDVKLADKIDMKTTTPQAIKSRLQVPYYSASSTSDNDVPNIKYLSEKYLSLESGGELQNSILFNSFLPDTRRQIYYLAGPKYLHSATNKMYVDAHDNLKADIDKVMLLDGSNSMGGDFDTGGHKISNIQDPIADSDAVTKKFMIENTTQSHVSSIGHENVFDKVMTDHTYQLSEENDIELGALVTYNDSLHKINKKAIDMRLILDSQKKFYSSRLGINMYPYTNDYYTMMIEIFYPDKIDKNTVDISVVAVYETINKVTTRVSDDHCRTLVQVHKTQQHGNNYLYVDIVMKMKTKQPYVPKLQCHLIIYGIKSYQSNVDSSVYDALWYIDNNEKLAFNTPITLQNQSISGVKDAKNDDDGINYKQLNTLEATLLGKFGALQPKSYYNTIFEYFYDLLDPSKFIMSDSLGSVVAGLNNNLVFNPTKLLADFDPNKGFMGGFEIIFNNVTGSNDWTIYMAFKNDYKPGDNKRIKINFVNGSSFDFPWVKVENNKLYLDYDLDVSYKQIRSDYIGKYMNLWYTKIGNQFRIGICNNSISLDKMFSGYTLNASSLQISSDYYVQRIRFSMTAYPINNKEYHKIQFLDKAKGVFFE